MGRHPNPDRKVELLDDIVEYLLEQGMSELSLRPLAKALGTSTYTIAYQFGSKDEMIVDALAYIVEGYRQRNRRAAALATSPSEVIDRFWSEDGSPEGERWRQLLFEVIAAPPRSDTDKTAAELLEVRRERFQESLAATGGCSDPVLGSTILLALLNGLAIDQVATGDTGRVDVAMDWVKDQAGELLLDLLDRVDVTESKPAEAEAI